MIGLAACRAFVAQWRCALPARARQISGMSFIANSAPCSHNISQTLQQYTKSRSPEIRQAFPAPVQSRPQTSSADISCSADRQAVQVHSSSGSKRRRGLQSHVQDTDPVHFGARAGQSIPSKADSSNGAASSSGMPDTRSRTPLSEADNSQTTTSSRQPPGPNRSLQPSYMPPHLFTARRRELQQSNDGHHEERAALPGSQVLSLNGTKAAAQQLKATLPPSDLGDFGEKAEGVIQIGTSGMRIPLYGKSMQSIQEAVQREAAGGAFPHRPVVAEDSLDIRERQVGTAQRDSKFDWSGSTNYTEMSRKTQEERARWQACRSSGSTEKVILNLPEGGAVSVLPLWVAVHQTLEGGLARLHESNVPLSEEVVEQLDVDLEPFCYTAGLKFEGSDERAGHWRNFFIGVVGDVDAQEEDNLWPNQVLHERRTFYNCRNGWDIARFLADATPEDVEAHLFNLRRIQEERKHRPGWCYHRLRTRWGEDALREFQISVNE